MSRRCGAWAQLFLAPPPLRFAQRALPHQRGGANYHCWLQGAIALGLGVLAGFAYFCLSCLSCLSLPIFAHLAYRCLSLSTLPIAAYLCLPLPILPTLPIFDYRCLPLPTLPIAAYLCLSCLSRLPCLSCLPPNKRGCAFQHSPICIIYNQLRLLAPDVEALGLTAVCDCAGRKLVSCILEVVYVSSYCRR